MGFLVPSVEHFLSAYSSIDTSEPRIRHPAPVKRLINERDRQENHARRKVLWHIRPHKRPLELRNHVLLRSFPVPFPRLRPLGVRLVLPHGRLGHETPHAEDLDAVRVVEVVPEVELVEVQGDHEFREGRGEVGAAEEGYREGWSGRVSMEDWKADRWEDGEREGNGDGQIDLFCAKGELPADGVHYSEGGSHCGAGGVGRLAEGGRR